MVKAVLNGEYPIIIPDHRAARPQWYTERGWEKARLKSMHDELIKGRVEGRQEVIYYIGAEEGEMPALCQMWGAKVVMFEPNPKAWSHIRAIWEANNLVKPKEFEIYPAFASDVTKLPEKNDFQELLELGEDGWPVCSEEEMIAAHGFKELDKEADYFPQITIDDAVEASRIVPTAISLDVEGSEGKVLRGAEVTIKVFRPKIWLSGHPEFLHENFRGEGGFENLHELRQWLRDFGYEEQVLDYDHEAHFFYKMPNKPLPQAQ